MNLYGLENNLCDTCKVNRVFDVCDREYGSRETAGCPNYIPTDFYYRDGTSWSKMNDGSTYTIVNMKNEDIAKAIIDYGMEKQLIECATKKGLLSKEMYDCLYGIIKEYISGRETNSYCRIKRPIDEYEKCLHENVNICIGKFFSYIQRMEDNGIICWKTFTKKLKDNYFLTPAQGKDIVVTYQDGNIQITQDLIFDDKGVVTCNDKAITFKHGWTRYACGKGEKDREECVIKVFQNQVNSIEMGKANWITSRRRYTLVFRNKKKMYFDMY